MSWIKVHYMFFLEYQGVYRTVNTAVCTALEALPQSWYAFRKRRRRRTRSIWFEETCDDPDLRAETFTVPSRGRSQETRAEQKLEACAVVSKLLQTKTPNFTLEKSHELRFFKRWQSVSVSWALTGISWTLYQRLSNSNMLTWYER